MALWPLSKKTERNFAMHHGLSHSFALHATHVLGVSTSSEVGQDAQFGIRTSTDEIGLKAVARPGFRHRHDAQRFSPRRPARKAHADRLSARDLFCTWPNAPGPRSLVAGELRKPTIWRSLSRSLTLRNQCRLCGERRSRLIISRPGTFKMRRWPDSLLGARGRVTPCCDCSG